MKRKIINILLASIFLFSLSVPVVFAQERTALVFSGSTIGGVTNLQMSGLAAVAKQFCNVEPTVIVSPTLAQVDIMKDGDSHFCTTYGYEAYFAYYGQDRWEEPYTGIRSMLPRPNATVQFAVPAKSDIKSVQDFKGKRLCLGRAGFGGELQSRTILEALDITDYTPVNLGHEDSLAAIVAGNADVYSNSGAFPHPSFLEMAETISGGIRIIGFTEEEINQIVERAPFFKAREMGPVYKGMTEAVLVPEVESMIAVREDVPEEIVYCITKSFWENREFAEMQWAGFKELQLEDVAEIRGSSPWHVGAYKYYVEKGLDIPEVMIPSELK